LSKYRYGKKIGPVSYVKMDPESASAFVKKLIKTPRLKKHSVVVDADEIEQVVADLRCSLSKLSETLDQIESLSEGVRYQISSIDASVEDLKSLV